MYTNHVDSLFQRLSILLLPPFGVENLNPRRCDHLADRVNLLLACLHKRLHEGEAIGVQACRGQAEQYVALDDVVRAGALGDRRRRLRNLRDRSCLCQPS